MKEYSLEELRQIKLKWYWAAMEDGSIRDCEYVARNLGVAGTGSPGPQYLWKKDGVSIFLDNYGGYMTVCFNGKRACSTHDTNRLFVPGEWINVVREALDKAAHTEEADKETRIKAEKEKLMIELGLLEE